MNFLSLLDGLKISFDASVPNNAALRQHEDTITECHKAGFVGDNNKGAVCQLGDLSVENTVFHLAVHGTGWLVQKIDLWAKDHRTGQRDGLLLTA